MSILVSLFSSVMFVGGVIIVSRQLSPTAQLVLGIVMMILAVIVK